ncbi:cell adhesion molecule DSCAM-like [Dysidea avara]|uniref:cell adhesion molecule DSCAM-like n=1 Tax=Dysidea avara TaxID=196820 RepID=UPI003332239B
MVGLGLDDCTVIQTIDLANGNTVTDPQDILELGMSNFTELVVVSNLLIRSLQRSDNGSYTCNVTNTLPETDTISVVSGPTLVTVLERPDPTNVIIMDYGSRYVYLQWDIPYNGNSYIMGYNLYIRFVNTNSDFTLVMTSSSMGKRQANMFTTTANSYNVTVQILPFMRYQFAVVACNELECGTLEAAGTSQIIQTQQDNPETPPVDCSATAVSSTSIRITWSPPVIPNGIITDYNVSYVPGQSLSTTDYSTDGNASINIGNNDTNTIVTDLRIATNYTIVLAAHTVVGIGPYSNPMECVVQTLEDVPDGPPLNVTLSSPTSTSIAVRWQLADPLVRNGIITKHQLNYTEVSQPLNWTTVSLGGDTSYVIEDLEIFTRYYVSVSAGTQIDGYGPFSDPVMIRIVPARPLNVTVQSVSEADIMLSWTEPMLKDETVLHYEVYYTPAGQGSTLSTNSTTTRITLSDLVPGVEYSINVTAVTTTGERITSTTVTAVTLTTTLFQLRIGPIPNCFEWIEDRQQQKLDDIISTVMEEITPRCSCIFEIVSDSFSCRGAQENFDNTVVFRARVSAQGPASVITADDVVNDISNWVESSPSITIASVTLDVDLNCPAMLDSFNSPDCVIVTEQPTPSTSSPTSSSSNNSSPIGIIAGAAIAVVVIVILLVIIVVLIVMYRKRKASYSIKERESEYDYITTRPVVYDSVNPLAPDHKLVTIEKNPAYKSTVLANKANVNPDADEYENIDLQPTSPNTDDAEMENPAYAETDFK